MWGPAVFWFGVAERVVYKRFSKCPGPCIARTWIKHTPCIAQAVSKFWQGWKESNLRMPESKSGALTNLATPLHRTAAKCYFYKSHTGNQPINYFCYQPTRGWACKLLHLRTFKPSGWSEMSMSCGKCANTALPEPVIRPLSCLLVNQSSDCLICGQNSWATGCKSL